jgi:hypothetical protein
MEEKMGNKGLAMALITVAPLLLAVCQPVLSQADVPTWSVGDSWAMGMEDFDLTPLINAISQSAQEMMPGVSYSGSGTMDYYALYKVTGETATQYRVSVKEALSMTMDLTVSGSYGGEQVSGSAHMELAMTLSGTLNFNKSDLSITGGNCTFDLTMELTGSMAGQSYDMTIEMSGNLNLACDPPLDLFDFPISVGDSWNVASTITMTGSVSGTARMPMIGEQSLDQELSETMPISLSASCPETTSIQMADGTTTTAYKIVLSGTTGDPFLLGSTLYYSPERGYIVGQEIDLNQALVGLAGGAREDVESTIGFSTTGEPLVFATTPMTEEQVNEGFARVKAMGEEDATALVLIVAAVVVALVVIGIIVGATRGRGSAG